MATQLWEIGLVIVASLFNSMAPIALKKGMIKLKGFVIKQIITNWYIYLGIGLYGFSYVISIPAFKGGEVSVLYPFIALAYIWVSFFSVRFLGEKMNFVKWTGIGLIIIGVSFIGFGR